MVNAFSTLMSKTLPPPYPMPLTPELEDNLTPDQTRWLVEAENLGDRANMTLRCESDRGNAFAVGEARDGVIQVAAAIEYPFDPDHPELAGIHLWGGYFSVHDWDAERFQRELDSITPVPADE